MPLGVFALAQEQRGDPVMFFQLSVNREGVISGAFQSTLSNDSKQVAGKVDKASQRVSWRIGDNGKTIYETTLANLTQEVSAVVVHFDTNRTQTWLLVRMPEPAPAGQEQKLPQAPKSPPPLKVSENAVGPECGREFRLSLGARLRVNLDQRLCGVFPTLGPSRTSRSLRDLIS
jgi:hypothetical protein